MMYKGFHELEGVDLNKSMPPATSIQTPLTSSAKRKARAQRLTAKIQSGNGSHNSQASAVGRGSGFGLQPSSNGGRYLYQTGGKTGSVNTKAELGLQVVDYFDYIAAEAGTGNVPQFVSNYYWSTDQNLFDTNPLAAGGSDVTFCRVRRVHVFVMPRVSDRAENSGGRSNADSMFTVNCQVPGYQALGVFGSKAYATNTQVTNVLPTINPQWKKVFKCDLQHTFQSGTILPVIAGQSDKLSDQCLFQMSIVDPTTGQALLTGDPDDEPTGGIRVKVILEIDQPINTISGAKFTVFRNEDFSLPFTPQNGSAYSGTSLQYAQIDLKKKLDKLN